MKPMMTILDSYIRSWYGTREEWQSNQSPSCATEINRQLHTHSDILALVAEIRRLEKRLAFRERLLSEQDEEIEKLRAENCKLITKAERMRKQLGAMTSKAMTLEDEMMNAKLYKRLREHRICDYPPPDDTEARKVIGRSEDFCDAIQALSDLYEVPVTNNEPRWDSDGQYLRHLGDFCEDVRSIAETFLEEIKNGKNSDEQQ